MRGHLKHAWVCTGCLATWIFQNPEEASEAEEASRLHRCHIEGATTVVVGADLAERLSVRFGRKPS